MSKTKKENDRPSKYTELNDSELEVVCGGASAVPTEANAKDFIPETIAFTKTEAA